MSHSEKNPPCMLYSCFARIINFLRRIHISRQLVIGLKIPTDPAHEMGESGLKPGARYPPIPPEGPIGLPAECRALAYYRGALVRKRNYEGLILRGESFTYLNPWKPKLQSGQKKTRFFSPGQAMSGFDGIGSDKWMIQCLMGWMEYQHTISIVVKRLRINLWVAVISGMIQPRTWYQLHGSHETMMW